MNFGKKLRHHRQLKEMSQAKLSEITDIPQTTISDLERNKYSPNINVLITLSQALGVTVQELLKEEGAHHEQDGANGKAYSGARG